MKRYLLCLLFLFAVVPSFSQEILPNPHKTYKNQFYLYWGWNRAWYSNSDIHFSGKDYDFSLDDVQAKDRQTEVALDPYLNPSSMTIPQTNFRLGYFFKDNWNISFGVDHMKYVMVQNQDSHISGTIDNHETEYDGTYYDDEIVLTEDFLTFEHTDGLNYVNVEIRRSDNLLDLNRYNLGKIDISITEGFGVGGMYPRSNVKLLNKERYDEFHVAGFGLGANVGLNITFWKYFFLQSELKGGYINMPDIRTSPSTIDKASQSFFFTQVNFLFGANFKF
jgi:hypothetical protein